MIRRLLILLILFSGLVTLSACRRAQTAQVALQPTATVTPRSTPLPAVATPLPIGTSDNPLQMVVRAAGTLASAENAAEILEGVLLDEAGLAVEIVPVTRYAEALGALCNSASGTVALAWLDGVSYAVAAAQRCGDASLQVERDDERGEPVQIVSASDTVNGIADLTDQTFCRISVSDSATWLIPSIMLQAGGVSPLYNLGAVEEYGDAVDLLEAVADGECAAAGVPASALAQSAQRRDLNVIAESASLPYGVLVYPPEVPLGLRLALDDALLALDTDAERALRDLIGQDALVAADERELDAVRDFVAESGIDLAALGA